MDTQKERDQKRLQYLKENASYLSRVTSVPQYFYETNREMNGKYGWFSSYDKLYNMTEYYSGWKFETEEKFNEFNKI